MSELFFLHLKEAFSPFFLILLIDWLIDASEVPFSEFLCLSAIAK